MTVINAILINNIVNQSKYIECNAKVTDVYYKTFKHLRADYIVLYIYNSREYTSEQQIISLNQYEVGYEIKIKIDPNYPESIQSGYQNTVLIGVDIFLAVYMAFMFLFLFKAKNKE